MFFAFADSFRSASCVCVALAMDSSRSRLTDSFLMVSLAHFFGEERERENELELELKGSLGSSFLSFADLGLSRFLQPPSPTASKPSFTGSTEPTLSNQTDPSFSLPSPPTVESRFRILVLLSPTSSLFTIRLFVISLPSINLFYPTFFSIELTLRFALRSHRSSTLAGPSRSITFSLSTLFNSLGSMEQLCLPCTSGRSLEICFLPFSLRGTELEPT